MHVCMALIVQQDPDEGDWVDRGKAWLGYYGGVYPRCCSLSQHWQVGICESQDLNCIVVVAAASAWPFRVRPFAEWVSGLIAIEMDRHDGPKPMWNECKQEPLCMPMPSNLKDLPLNCWKSWSTTVLSECISSMQQDPSKKLTSQL